MEPPSRIGPRGVRDGAAAVLRATRVWGNDPACSSRRARYTAGRVGDRVVPSYLDEEGVDPARRTETFAEVVMEVNNWRWAGVPFRLRAGKALRKLDKHVVITFREPNWVPAGLLGYERPDRMYIGLDPEVLRLISTSTAPWIHGLAAPWLPANQRGCGPSLRDCRCRRNRSGGSLIPPRRGMCRGERLLRMDAGEHHQVSRDHPDAGLGGRGLGRHLASVLDQTSCADSA
jgi:Glucose-6-phosphate dehydrogenase, C-terminal domain